VDLLCRDEAGGYVAVEIKRRGEIDGVEQLTRYLDRLELGLEGVRGVFAALSFAPQARVLARARGIDCVQVDYDALRGMESDTPRLF
jgi:RecB family endonuclease NucS